ncbi:MAG TPA: alpha-L-arabinofuranosidase C-terminal domain-containing protein [Verrucomicrobiae bacterium]|nr:alpha-L-arabinofuranosidase C-terminal domain-containing protein [Verrucomicrobiae bacterium]
MRGFGLLGLATGISLHAATAVIDVDTAKPGPEINPRMYGIFLEEINTGVDGGLYAELIRNRGFEDAKAPEGFSFINGHWDNGRGYVIPYHFAVDHSLPYWSLVQEGDARGALSLDLQNPLNAANPRSCRLEIRHLRSGRLGIANEGYWGIAVRAGEKYQLTFWARCDDRFAGKVTATLESTNGLVLSDAPEIGGLDGQWKRYTATLAAARTDPRARFILAANSQGTVWFDFVSLFPRKTFRDRPNGLRPDIARMIADLHPGFMRFPGGCVVEGATPENAYDWKKSIGPVEQREEIWNAWDYRRTHGMGFHEYLQFAEDIGAAPLYVGFAGQTCIYRHPTNVPLSQMAGVESNFLDALDYADGPTNSTWGKLRAAAGHPGPFHLQMAEIGNENVGPAYAVRYQRIQALVKERYPSLLTIAYEPLRAAPVEMVDEHYYSSPRWFMDNFHLYDQRSRQAPPVYLGEVATTSAEGGPDKGNLISALAEGVFLMGAERNSDVVRMVSYAPLLANVHGRTELAGSPPPWHGMIYFDSSRVFGTVSYYLWKTFAENLPRRTLQTRVTFPGNEYFRISGQVGIGTWDTSAEFKDIRVEQNDRVLYASDFSQNADGWQAAGREAGQWAAADGVYRQGRAGRASSFLGETGWSDYTLTLAARKLSGTEGFLIMFGRKGRDLYWWNLGGWGNTRDALEHSLNGSQSPVGQPVEGHIETGRWYRIKIILAQNRIRCFLDGKLIHDEAAQPLETFFASVGRDDQHGDVILKAINVSSEPCVASLNFHGLVPAPSRMQITLLTSAELSDNNSLDDPARVVPQTMEANLSGPVPTYSFPPRSLVVLRMAAEKRKP